MTEPYKLCWCWCRGDVCCPVPFQCRYLSTSPQSVSAIDIASAVLNFCEAACAFSSSFAWQIHMILTSCFCLVNCQSPFALVALAVSHNSCRPSILILIISVLSSCLFRVFLIFLLLPLSEEITLLDPSDNVEFVVGVVNGATSSSVATACLLQVSTSSSSLSQIATYIPTLPFSSCVCIILRSSSSLTWYLRACLLARLLHHT